MAGRCSWSLLLLLVAQPSNAELAASSSDVAVASNTPPTQLAAYTPPLPDDDSIGRHLAEAKPKRKFCNTTTYGLKGDYAYEACGAFCKSAKATNHCKCASHVPSELSSRDKP